MVKNSDLSQTQDLLEGVLAVQPLGNVHAHQVRLKKLDFCLQLGKPVAQRSALQVGGTTFECPVNLRPIKAIGKGAYGIVWYAATSIVLIQTVAYMHVINFPTHMQLD